MFNYKLNFICRIVSVGKNGTNVVMRMHPTLLTRLFWWLVNAEDRGTWEQMYFIPHAFGERCQMHSLGLEPTGVGLDIFLRECLEEYTICRRNDPMSAQVIKYRAIYIEQKRDKEQRDREEEFERRLS